jgi:predicted metal-dependent hydrolase
VVGTYHEKSDRVLVTRRLDSPQVPEFVLDFVMYHELLHKALGTGRGRDGRRRVHGPEFRRLERRFRGYREAEEWLKRL